MKLQSFVCDICGFSYTEKQTGHGAPAWGQFNGIKLDGIDNPLLCPDHKVMLADHLDKMKQEIDYHNDPFNLKAGAN